MGKIIIRAFTFCVLVAAMLPATAAYAGQTTVGVIVPATDPFALKAHDAFVTRLRETGNLGGIKLLKQQPQPDKIALNNTARQLIAHKVDVLVTYGTPATLAAIGEDPGMPHIYGGVYKPLHDSFRRKGSRGICINPPLSSLTRYIAASIRNKAVGILYCGNERDSLVQMEQMVRFTGKAGLRAKPIDLRKAAEVSATLSGADVGLFFITTSTCSHSCREAIVRISRNRNIPAASVIALEGLEPVIAYYSDPEQVGRMMADELVRTIGGGNAPADAAGCATDSDLILNVREARRLGLSIPMELVTGASKVIY